MKPNVLILFFSLSLLSVCSNAQEAVIEKYSNLSLDFETRATDLVAQMTLEEKNITVRSRSTCHSTLKYTGVPLVE